MYLFIVIYPLIIFCSALSISLTAAYFSIVGLATMFPGSKEAIIVMGAVLEVGKLIAAVWLHKNWYECNKFIRGYLFIAVLILTGITSMGIFGFLSRSHVEHSASIEQEQALVASIDLKINRTNNFILREEDSIKKLSSREGTSSVNNSDVVEMLESRIQSLKEESQSNLALEQVIIDSVDSRIIGLDKVLAESQKATGLFSNSSNKYNGLKAEQEEERASLSARKSKASSRVELIKDSLGVSLLEVRDKIDGAQSAKENFSNYDSEIKKHMKEVEDAHDKVATLESEKFKYSQKVRELEVEVGPIKYISGLLDDWIGIDVDLSEAIRIIVILIFVFDPLAILLLIAASISYGNIKEEDLPPEVKDIRNKLLEELEEYLSEGGLAEHFVDRAKK